MMGIFRRVKNFFEERKMIKILHLYYDIMNMYGESANVRALMHALDKEDVKYKVDFKYVTKLVLKTRIMLF